MVRKKVWRPCSDEKARQREVQLRPNREATTGGDQWRARSRQTVLSRCWCGGSKERSSVRTRNAATDATSNLSFWLAVPAWPTGLAVVNLTRRYRLMGKRWPMAAEQLERASRGLHRRGCLAAGWLHARPEAWACDGMIADRLHAGSIMGSCVRVAIRGRRDKHATSSHLAQRRRQRC